MVLVRPRDAADLPGCVEVLSEVHQSATIRIVGHTIRLAG